MTATKEQVQNGLTYQEIEVGTLLGAIQFTNTWTDFRKQEIPAGTYLFRFASQPETGDHEGTAPHREFCLLTPVDRDRKPEPMELKKLVELSVRVTKNQHPGVMLLFPNYKPGAKPTWEVQEKEIHLLRVKRPILVDGKTSHLGFAFTLQGHSSTR